jgi:hypothetical protein
MQEICAEQHQFCNFIVTVDSHFGINP